MLKTDKIELNKNEHYNIFFLLITQNRQVFIVKKSEI